MEEEYRADIARKELIAYMQPWIAFLMGTNPQIPMMVFIRTGNIPIQEHCILYDQIKLKEEIWEDGILVKGTGYNSLYEKQEDFLSNSGRSY